MEYVPDDVAGIARLERLIEGESGPAADALKTILGRLADGDGFALTWLGPELSANVVAGLCNVSLSFVGEHADEMGGIDVVPGRSIMAQRFDRDRVIAWREKARAEALETIRQSSARRLAHGLD